MQVTQIAELLNTISKEVLGESAVVKEDLSNVVDIGAQLTADKVLDNYVESLVDQIGKMVFVARKYTGRAPKVLMDAWEYGSITEKISMNLQDAQENESWQLIDGATYEQNIFYKPEVTVKLFNNLTTFEIPISITRVQVKESFTNVMQLNRFLDMIFNSVENSMEKAMENLIMRTINNFTAETIHNRNGARNVKLLTMYNTQFTKTLTAEQALYDIDFLRFASTIIADYVTYISNYTTAFNIGGQDKFTPKDMLHVVMLSTFAHSFNSYLQSDTYHKELTALPLYEEVGYWQGLGTPKADGGFTFAEVSKINVKTASGNDVEQSYIIGIMFDRDALGVHNFDRRTPVAPNAKAEFFNYYFKEDARYFNDFNENFIVFYLA